jgi:hypothetical protein
MRELSLGLLVLLLIQLPMAAYAQETIRVTAGTEQKIANTAGIQAKFCATVVDAGSKQPAAAKWRRSLNGTSRDLGVHTGSWCLRSKTGVYAVYITAIDHDVLVFPDERTIKGGWIFDW